MSWLPFSGLFAKPRRLSKPCDSCRQEIPFDPTNPLCSHCSYATNISTSQGPNTYTFTNPSNEYTSYSSPTLSSSVKRPADSVFEGEYPNKRSVTSPYHELASPLARRTVVGPAAPVRFGTPSFSEQTTENLYQDAYAGWPHGHGSVHGRDGVASNYRAGKTVSLQQLENEPTGVVDNEIMATETTATSYSEDTDADDAEIEMDDVEVEDEDLFNKTFGRSESQDSEDEGGDQASDEEEAQPDEAEDEDVKDGMDVVSPQEAEMKLPSQLATKTLARKSAADQKDNDLGPISGKKSSLKSVSSAPSRVGVELLTGPLPVDPEKDLCKNQKQFEAFKDKAIELIPRLPLHKDRYWIGVLHENVKPKNIKNETDFLWMKGNRFTTVSTVWHTFSTTTASEGFVLLLGFEKPGFGDRMEELDYFNEQKIIFRVVDEKSPAAKGRKMCEDVIPPEVVQTEVIELD